MPEAVDQLGESAVSEAVGQGGVDQLVGDVAVGPGDRVVADLWLLRVDAAAGDQEHGRQHRWQDETVESRSHRSLTIRLRVDGSAEYASLASASQAIGTAFEAESEWWAADRASGRPSGPDFSRSPASASSRRPLPGPLDGRMSLDSGSGETGCFCRLRRVGLPGQLWEQQRCAAPITRQTIVRPRSSRRTAPRALEQ